MNNKKIYFRVDGGQQIGLGHIVRCTALAQMLCGDFNIEFICKEIPESNIDELKALGFPILIIKSEEDFLRRLTSEDIVVIDHYSLDSGYQVAVKEVADKLVCIDDMHEKDFFADLIINPAPNIAPADYRTQIYTQFALGTDYVLLRPAFLKKANEIRIMQEISVAFVCFGGSDIPDLTRRVVNILKDDSRFKKINVVVGPSYLYLNSLIEITNSDPRFFLHRSIGEEMVCNLIAEAHLAIIPSSGILQEVLAIGCTAISGMYIANQKYNFENFKALGAFESADDFSVKKLIAAIDRCFKEKHRELKIIDGKSKERLRRLFFQLTKENMVVLRRINETDIDKTFEWASSREIRKFSFNQTPVEYENHKKWFINKINDKGCFYYLGQLGDQTFGSIRFDIEGVRAKISYLIDPAHQGKGLGIILLKKGLDQLIKESTSNISSVWGEVFTQNQASIKAFERLGYGAQTDPSNNFVKFEKKIPSKILI